MRPRWPFGPVERLLGPMVIESDSLRIWGNKPLLNDGGTRASCAISTLVEANASVTAELCGVSVRTICRWKRHGISDDRADRLAIHLGVHPSALWPNWFAEAKP